jgi:hypothetical protein
MKEGVDEKGEMWELGRYSILVEKEFNWGGEKGEERRVGGKVKRRDERGGGL